MVLKALHDFLVGVEVGGGSSSPCSYSGIQVLSLLWLYPPQGSHHHLHSAVKGMSMQDYMREDFIN